MRFLAFVWTQWGERKMKKSAFTLAMVKVEIRYVLLLKPNAFAVVIKLYPAGVNRMICPHYFEQLGECNKYYLVSCHLILYAILVLTAWFTGY